jgi:PPOX class probable F420-dependent enzyme
MSHPSRPSRFLGMNETTMPTLEGLAEERTVLLTTFKKDGTPVGTPVSIVVRDGHAYFRTYDQAWKVKRLRNNPMVTVAPSTVRGKPTAPAVAGRTRLLTEAEARPIRRLLARKHPLLHRVLVPLFHKLKGYKTLHYQLDLEPEHTPHPTAR